ncbi:MAG: hypothetical protein KIT25_16960 [Enhydrobacter sp.]|nr:MAG: hypothetical protein KIT25_16960 [Enhydrobacter sp.]
MPRLPAFDTDLMSFLLFLVVLLVASQAVRRYVQRDTPVPPRASAGATAAPAGPGAAAAFARTDAPAFQSRLMRFARAVAATYGRGSRHPLEYTTPAGTPFRFTLQREAATGWRIYIDQQPSYRGRDEGGHETHRYVDEAGRHFICWDGAIRGAEQAVFVAARWALLTERYIATGERF